MTAGTRRIQETEKPGRLHLAIIEWQRELVRRREAQRAVRADSSGSASDSAGAQMLQDQSSAA
jgi:hypothetical protein